jgi:hypothetical protein
VLPLLGSVVSSLYAGMGKDTVGDDHVLALRSSLSWKKAAQKYKNGHNTTLKCMLVFRLQLYVSEWK